MEPPKSSGPTADDPPLAYLDAHFLKSDGARPVRILSEYLHPMQAFEKERVKETVVVFGSARIRPDGPLGRYYDDARELSRLLTVWADGGKRPGRRVLICTGGGPGIMEAGNRGALDAGGRSIGLNVGLPHEQRPNPFITPDLNFEFHYFFMRKLWFAHLARALVVFPGGFGTLDELFEMLTLVQTRKFPRPLFILLYGPEYWNQIVNFEALARFGTISPEDLELFHFVDTPQDAFQELTRVLGTDVNGETPAFAPSATPQKPVTPSA